MKLSRKPLAITIVMMALAMTGLTFVQVQLLRNAFHLKEQAFDRNAVAALSMTAQQMELRSIHREAVTVFSQATLSDTLGAKIIIKQINLDQMDPAVFDKVGVDTMDQLDPNVRVFFHDDRHEVIQRVVSDMMVLAPMPLTERTSEARIDSLLAVNLKILDIGMNPNFAVMSTTGDSLVLSNVADPEISTSKSSYRTQLFPLDFQPSAFELVLWFPERTRFLVNQIWPMGLASLVFMIVVAVSFWLNLRIISEQRRASSSMIDFINNMTHEFKTPISTVNLASEAIAGGEFQNCPDSLQRYNRMIRQETQRMSLHTERILQFAYLEDGDFAMNGTTFSMHKVIRESCEPFLLSVENMDGRLILDLSAEHDFILGNDAHLANVVTNLVDNAIKYSPVSPCVQVITRNISGWFVMEVSDTGLGIPNADHSRVFERYFRCSTGNRHDVKGFGLGLSYVKLLIDAHKGRIELNSREGKGTTMRIFLPAHTPEQRHG